MDDILFRKYGFWGILAFASWPNMAFDLCGLASGHFLIPFWTFFGATWIGKAVIKVNLQAIFFIILGTPAYLASLIQLIASFNSDIAEHAQEFLNSKKQTFRSGQNNNNSSPMFAQIWGYIMIIFISWFIKSTIESLAIRKQAEKDEEKVKNL